MNKRYPLHTVPQNLAYVEYSLVARRVAEIRRLEAEHFRLTNALEKIIREAESDNGLTAWDGADIARAALNEINKKIND